jgi:hypothetical protein
VRFDSEEDVQKALGRDRELMGQRYIEVFKSSRSELDRAQQRYIAHMEDQNKQVVVRMRGLPFKASVEEIVSFFEEGGVKPNAVHILIASDGRATGEAYAEFNNINEEEGRKAMQRHRQQLGNRYVELFRSSSAELASVLAQQSHHMQLRSYLAATTASAYYSTPAPAPPFSVPQLHIHTSSSRSWAWPDSMRLEPLLHKPETVGQAPEFLVWVRGLPSATTDDQLLAWFHHQEPPLRPSSVRIIHPLNAAPSKPTSGVGAAPPTSPAPLSSGGEYAQAFVQFHTSYERARALALHRTPFPHPPSQPPPAPSYLYLSPASHQQLLLSVSGSSLAPPAPTPATATATGSGTAISTSTLTGGAATTTGPPLADGAVLQAAAVDMGEGPPLLYLSATPQQQRTELSLSYLTALLNAPCPPLYPSPLDKLII